MSMNINTNTKNDTTTGIKMDPQATFSQKFFRIFIATLLLLVFIFAGTTFYLYKKVVAQRATPQELVAVEVRALVAKVDRLVVLPLNETPTVATVADLTALKDQVFFTDAKKGDKVLIYNNAKKAILYDPVLNKIVNVAPLNIGEVPKEASPTVSTPPTKLDSVAPAKKK